MCGIIGGVGNVNFAKVVKGTLLLKHRGTETPNTISRSGFVFSHVRLPIIDLNKRSIQPMMFENLVITFNGEIYNYKEIRKELIALGRKFKTQSDTEVILQAYDEWDYCCVRRFIGRWAFCIYNTHSNTAFLSRDRVGECPLVWTIQNDSLCFASELPALLELVDKKRLIINKEALKFANKGYCHHLPYNLTPYRGIYKLEPGTNLFFKNGEIEKRRYWFPSWKLKSKSKDYEKVITRAIERVALSDVPIAVLLSGGVDSTTIAYILRDKKPLTYTIGWDKNDPDFARAKKVADYLGLENRQIIFNSKEVWDRLKSIKKLLNSQYGMPLNIKQHILTYLIAKQAKKDGIKVLISGNGFDELAMGYDTARITKLLGHLPNLKYLKYGKIGKEIDKLCNSKLFIDKAQWLGLMLENEHSLTIAPDVGGMACAVEIRSPAFDVELMEYFFGLPISCKVNDVENKHIMKDFIRQKLGTSYLYGKKTGFGSGIR